MDTNSILTRKNRPMTLTSTDYVPAWHDKAACRNYNSKGWLKGGSRQSTIHAKAVCNTECPVKDTCLEWIRRIDQHNQGTSDGVFGGLTLEERRATRYCYNVKCNNLRNPDKLWEYKNFCSKECQIENEEQVRHKLDRTLITEYYMRGTIRNGKGTA